MVGTWSLRLADHGQTRRRDVIDVEEWAEIRRLHRAEGMAVKAIVRHLGVARNTVRAALRSDAPPAYEREGPGSAVEPSRARSTSC